MSYYASDVDGGYFTFDERLSALSELISMIDRPGDYCVYGRFPTPMPRIWNHTTGLLAFPLQPAQLQDLITLGERAPYGRGAETILDRSVRDCWQVSPDQISVGGETWGETFNRILNRAAEGLGYPPEAVDAELYKILVYEEGGFFAPHRDTEKVTGMVATLVVSLPVAGKGGELIIRHRGRETIVEMCSNDPSELVFAAFYADCEHEIRPVTEGHRACLVYNLVLTPGQNVATSAPNYADLMGQIAKEIKNCFATSDAPEKLVWLLEHDYSIAGLSFETLKNTDATVGRALIAAAAQADCSLHAAIVHVDEYAAAAYLGRDYVWEIEDIGADEYELYDIIERRCELDDWVHPDLGASAYGQLALAQNELMPPERITNWEPDVNRLTEASGNEGATVERHYRSAAFVLWPAKEGPRVLAQAGAKALSVLFVQSEQRAATSDGNDLSLDTIAAEIAEAWPAPQVLHYSDRDEWQESGAVMLSRLCRIGSRKATELFLDRVVIPYYGPGLKAALIEATSELAEKDMLKRLLGLVSAQCTEQPEAVINLVMGLSEASDQGQKVMTRNALKDLIKHLCSEIPVALNVHRPKNAEPFWYGSRRQSATPLPERTLREIFQLAWSFDLESSLAGVVGNLVNAPDIVPPDRTLPPVLAKLGTSFHAQASESEAFARFWRHSANVLLARSRTTPPEPTDWVVSSNDLGCGCEYCAELVRFCADPVTTTHRIPVRRELRSHLRSVIERAGADLSCETERKGSPYTLICTKTRDSYTRRRQQYANDISAIKRLLEVADAVPEATSIAASLRAAVNCSQSNSPTTTT